MQTLLNLSLKSCCWLCRMQPPASLGLNTKNTLPVLIAQKVDWERSASYPLSHQGSSWIGDIKLKLESQMWSSAVFGAVHIGIQCSKCHSTMTDYQIHWIISLKARRQSNFQLSPIYVYKWKAQFEPYLTEQTMPAWG